MCFEVQFGSNQVDGISIILEQQSLPDLDFRQFSDDHFNLYSAKLNEKKSNVNGRRSWTEIGN